MKKFKNLIIVAILPMAAFFHAEIFAAIQGDIDGSGHVDLNDAITGLRVCSDIIPSVSIYKESDVNGDQKIGLEEVVCTLQVLAELRCGTEWSIEIKDPIPGKTVRPLLGVNAGPYPAGEPGNPDMTGKYQQIGVNMVRTHDFYNPLDMSKIYPDRSKDPNQESSYYFAESDIRFQAIISAGLEPYFRIGDSYNNVKGPSSSELSNWVQAAVQVIRHYKQGLWNGFTSDFRYAEIWNEPDNRHFWPEPLTMTDYFNLYVQTAKALSAAFPDLKIGGPGWTPAGALSPKGQQISQQFVAYVKDNNAPLDFLSWHIYSNLPTDYRDAARFYRNLLDANGYDSAESHITEWNTDIGRSNDTDPEAVALRVGGKGAALDTAFWIELQNEGVDVSTFFRGNDTSMNLTTFYGLFKADGTPKKAADAFRLWSMLCQYADKTELLSTRHFGTADLNILAGRKSSGSEIAVLISNYSDKQTKYCLSGSVDMSNISIYEVSDASTGDTPYSGSKTNSIGAYTVQLVVIR